MSLYMWSKRNRACGISKFSIASPPYKTKDGYLSWFSKISHLKVQNPIYFNSLPTSSGACLSSTEEKIAKLKELLGSLHRDKRPEGGFQDIDIYHMIIDNCNNVLSDM